jgi:ABC-type antimicrobial peptide transport system permease subunit
MTIAARTNSGGPEVESLLRSTVMALNPEVPVTEVKTMQAVVSQAVSTPASLTLLFGIFAGVALILGMVGIYGVLSFLVSKRAREMGIRIALGAQRTDVLWLVMKEGAKFSFLGIGWGLIGAFIVTRLLASQLYGVGPVDAITYISVTLLVAAVSLAACAVPARRAMRVDPMVALRYQ